MPFFSKLTSLNGTNVTMFEVSIYRNRNDNTSQKVVSLAAWLTSRKHASTCADLQEIALYMQTATGNDYKRLKADKDKIKATLPIILPAGIFKHRRNAVIIKHSGFMQFDIDLQDNLHVEDWQAIQDELASIDQVAHVGAGSSGFGLWGLVKIAYPNRYREHFNFFSDVLKEMDLKPDTQVKAVNSARYYSYDKTAYTNLHGAKRLFKYKVEYHKYRHVDAKATSERFEVFMSELDTNIIIDHNHLLNVGIVLAQNYGSDAQKHFEKLYRLFQPGTDGVDIFYNKLLDAYDKKEDFLPLDFLDSLMNKHDNTDLIE